MDELQSRVLSILLGGVTGTVVVEATMTVAVKVMNAASALAAEAAIRT